MAGLPAMAGLPLPRVHWIPRGIPDPILFCGVWLLMGEGSAKTRWHIRILDCSRVYRIDFVDTQFFLKSGAFLHP